MSRPLTIGNTIPAVKSAVGDALAVDNASLVLLGLLSTVGSSVIINDVKTMCPSLLTFWFTKFIIFYAMIYLIIRKPLVSLVWAVSVSLTWNFFTRSMSDGDIDGDGHADGCDACDGRGQFKSHINLKELEILGLNQNIQSKGLGNDDQSNITLDVDMNNKKGGYDLDQLQNLAANL